MYYLISTDMLEAMAEQMLRDIANGYDKPIANCVCNLAKSAVPVGEITANALIENATLVQPLDCLFANSGAYPM